MAVKFLTNEQRQQADDGLHLSLSGQMVIGLLFLMALVAFEIFNFDTTRYALDNLLGGVTFAGLRWATVLAIAFCAIDFAGLVRFFLPEEEDAPTPVGVWYLMGAWLLGATMNALMTWWAVSLTLLNHDLGNEVLSRQQLLEVVPVFVAVLVWLTRILFIGAFTVAGNWMFDFANLRRAQTKRQARQITSRPALAQGQPRRASLPRPTPLPAGLRPVREPDHVPAIFRRLRREEPAVVGAAGMTADERRSQRLSRPEPVPAVFSAAGEDE
ncbi:MAG: hypothetical protein GX579_07010 [Chloroflexi bacterium]|nr:hypothetical protein [Chloroflexota bacterium]